MKIKPVKNTGEPAYPDWKKTAALLSGAALATVMQGCTPKPPESLQYDGNLLVPDTDPLTEEIATAGVPALTEELSIPGEPVLTEELALAEDIAVSQGE